MYKILIIKNRFKGKLDFKKGIKWLEDNTPLKIEVTEMETDFDLEFEDYGNATYKGFGVAGSEKDKFRPLVPRNTYHVVGLVYGNKAPGVRVSVTNNSPLFPETEFIQLARVNDGGVTFNHELFHTFFKRLKRKGIFVDDPIDKVKIDGKTHHYYKDSSLKTDKPTNRTIAMERLAPYWDKVAEIGMFADIINAILPPQKKSYRYFSEREVTGLKDTFTTFLDEVRHRSGFPFVLTSTLRTGDTAHAKGVAADIRCPGGLLYAILNVLPLSPRQRYELLPTLVDLDILKNDKQAIMAKHALALGCTRIGIYNLHIHLDLDTSRDQRVVWIGKSE